MSKGHEQLEVRTSTMNTEDFQKRKELADLLVETRRSDVGKLHHREGVIAATEQKLQNGEEVPMERERCAMHVACIMRNSLEKWVQTKQQY